MTAIDGGEFLDIGADGRTLCSIPLEGGESPMCSEYEPDRVVRNEQEQAQAEIQRLFERYRAASRPEAATKREAGLKAPDALEEQEPALASR